MTTIRRIHLPYIDLYPGNKEDVINTFPKLPDVLIPFTDIVTGKVVKVPFGVSYRRSNGRANNSMTSRQFPSVLAAELSHLAADESFINSWGGLVPMDYNKLLPVLTVLGNDGLSRPPNSIYYKRITQGKARNTLNLHLGHGTGFTTTILPPDFVFDFDTPNPEGDIRGMVRMFGYDDSWVIHNPIMKLTGLFTKEEIERAVLDALRGTYPFMLGSLFRDFEIVNY